MGTLYVVGTPIGNLEDISQRALRTLRQVSLIAAESPARTQRLLARYDIRTPMMRYTDAYDRKKRVRMQAVLAALEEGDVALVSEAGMPGLSDPGYELLRAAVERGVHVVPVPGPTAVTAALSVSGFPPERYVFVGFLPRQRTARRKLLTSLVDAPYPVVAYESPHRLLETLQDVRAILGQRRLSVSCELTKLYEETRHGTAGEVLAHFQAHAPRGEFTLVMAGKSADRRKNTDQQNEADRREGADQQKNTDQQNEADRWEGADQQKNTDQQNEADRRKGADQQKNRSAE